MDLKNFIKLLPLKEKYIEILLNDKKVMNIKLLDNNLEKGKITIQKYLVWSELKMSYSKFIKKIAYELETEEDEVLKYIGYIEYIIDKKTKVGVGYGIIYNLLNNLSGINEIENLEKNIQQKINLLDKLYNNIIKKSNNIETFFYFLQYVNILIYLEDASKNNRYTSKDIKDIDVKKELEKDEIIINIEVFLTYLYNNILKIDKDEKFILETIEKYPMHAIFLLQRIYKKYINSNFELEKVPDVKFENIAVV